MEDEKEKVLLVPDLLEASVRLVSQSLLVNEQIADVELKLAKLRVDMQEIARNRATASLKADALRQRILAGTLALLFR